MTWNVFYYDFNSDKIKIFNIFDHGRFREDVVSALKKCKTKPEFADRIHSELRYYFWAKCEWETVIAPWIGDKAESGLKVDVYWQIRMNWDKFIDYLWDQRGIK